MDKPMFIKIDDYKDIEDIVHLIKNKIDDAKKTLFEIDSLKRQEEEELAKWQKQIDEIEKRVETINKTLTENTE